MQMVTVRHVGWSKERPFGAELVEVQLGRDVLAASGVAIGSAPFPYRLDYELETSVGFVTTRLHVTVRGGGRTRSLDLRRSTEGAWTSREDGAPADRPDLAGALDVDLELSPLFNTMPVLRHGLARGGAAVDFTMAWVSVPDLAVHRSPQRYAFDRVLDGGGAVVRFEALAGSGFAADVTFDRDGLVLDYPDLAVRLR
jgi:hypothetical protein